VDLLVLTSPVCRGGRGGGAAEPEISGREPHPSIIQVQDSLTSVFEWEHGKSADSPQCYDII